MKKFKKPQLTLEQRTSITGAIYIVPFIIGFLLFFLTPMVKSVIYSFSDVKFDFGGVITDFIGLKNYSYIFNKDLEFKSNLTIAISDLMWKTPVILIMRLYIMARLKGKSNLNLQLKKKHTLIWIL